MVHLDSSNSKVRGFFLISDWQTMAHEPYLTNALVLQAQFFGTQLSSFIYMLTMSDFMLKSVAVPTVTQHRPQSLK